MLGCFFNFQKTAQRKQPPNRSPWHTPKKSHQDGTVDKKKEPAAQKNEKFNSILFRFKNLPHLHSGGIRSRDLLVHGPKWLLCNYVLVREFA
jgi:hypothetical protein